MKKNTKKQCYVMLLIVMLIFNSCACTEKKEPNNTETKKQETEATIEAKQKKFKATTENTKVHFNDTKIKTDTIIDIAITAINNTSIKSIINIARNAK